MSRDVEQRIAGLVREDVRAMSAYHVPDPSGLVKLDAMENPFELPEELRAELGRRLAAQAINRYPDPQARELKLRLRAAFDIDSRWELLLGNGSDEIIQLLIAALASPGCEVLVPTPTFVMFRNIAQMLNVGCREVPLRADFGLDMPAMLDAIARHRPRLVFLACPNNPTGNLWPEADVRAIIAACPGLVVIDEAYTAFASREHTALLLDYPNVVVMRTLSKMGLAGVRLGYLVGDPGWIAELDKVRMPYNVGCLNQAAAGFALEHIGRLREQTGWLCGERAWLAARLAGIAGLQSWPSETNFLLLRLVGGDAPGVHAAMRARGVLVKCLHGSHPLLADCLRVTVGSRPENERMLAALADALHARP